MRKVILSLVALALIGIAGGGGWYWWTTGRFFESTDNAYVQGDISVISPKVAGYVREVRVVDNQQVRAGDVLALIDDEDFAAKTAEARAAVAAEQAAIAGIDRRLEWQASMIEAAKANVVSAQAELARAQPNYERYKKMVATNIVAKSDYDQVEATLRKAEAEVTRTQAAVTAEQGQLVVLLADRKQADAQLAQAQAALTAAKNDLDNTVIKRAGRRRGRQQGRAGRPVRQGRHAADGGGAAAAGLCRRQLQGDPAREHAAGPVGRDRGRRLSRTRS